MELGLEQCLFIISVWFQFLAIQSEEFWKHRRNICKGGNHPLFPTT